MSRILTGDRPTGALHLGHYFGTLANRVRLQCDGHEIFVVVADYQVITDRARPERLRESVRGLVRDYLAVGLDPDATVIFPHSAIPALNQLMLPFLSLVSMGELTRNPTVKDEIANAGRESVSGLTFTYPVHQAADILFCKGELVPVGRDQLPHLELTRSIARRFGERYGAIFPLPEALLGDAPVLRGLDGRKMGKSLGNAIALSDDLDTIATKIRGARTDSEHTITYDPDARPEIANLLTIAALCSGRSAESIADEIGSAGAARLKATTIEAVDELLTPIRERRAAIGDDEVKLVLSRGVKTATAIAETTLAEVVGVMGMDVITL